MDEQPVETTLYSLSDDPPPPRDRRDDERQLTLFRVGSVTIGDRRELCLIKNVSAGGMLVRAYCPMERGAAVSVELKQGKPVTGRIAWSEGDNVGIAFDRRVDVVDLLASSMDGPRPRMPRVEVRCLTTVREGADLHRLWARDISQGGLKVESLASLSIGANVVVAVPGLDPQPGVVRWAENGFQGITFNRLLPLPTLIEWLKDQRERLRAAG